MTGTGICGRSVELGASLARNHAQRTQHGSHNGTTQPRASESSPLCSGVPYGITAPGHLEESTAIVFCPECMILSISGRIPERGDSTLEFCSERITLDPVDEACSSTDICKYRIRTLNLLEGAEVGNCEQLYPNTPVSPPPSFLLCLQ
jgi:hypothetical protein